MGEVPDQTARDTPAPHERAAGTGPRVFWCNTNRGSGAGGNSLERGMRARRFVAAWLPFNYEDHIRAVRRGDLILMYANGLGVIGVGRAVESRLELLGHDHPDRIRVFAADDAHEEEWRIPVEWLAWDEGNPCPVEPIRGTFLDITHHDARIRSVFSHFPGLPPVPGAG